MDNLNDENCLILFDGNVTQVEELEILHRVSMSKASEIQNLEKQLASTQQQLQLEVDAKERLEESKEAEIQQLLKERDSCFREQ